MLDPALQQHNAVRDELRWACSLRNDPLNVSVCGLLYVDMSSNRISDEGAAAFAQYLFHDNWLQGEKRLHRGAACSLARRGVSHIHARTHTCCCAALNLQNNELGEEGILSILKELGISSEEELETIKSAVLSALPDQGVGYGVRGGAGPTHEDHPPVAPLTATPLLCNFRFSFCRPPPCTLLTRCSSRKRAFSRR